MDTWYSVDIGDGKTSYEPIIKIQRTFIPIFAAAGYPHELAVYARFDKRKNIVTAYFSPSANEIAKIFNASPCDEPSWDNLAFLVGDTRCWRIHFPNMPPM